MQHFVPTAESDKTASILSILGSLIHVLVEPDYHSSPVG